MGAAHQQADPDAIRRRISLVRTIGRTVKLRAAGKGAKGLCPFHQEKTPSFVVDDSRGSYHCFGCGAHGDVFDWVMHSEGCDFVAAIKLLAEDSDLTGAAMPAARESDRPARSSDVVDSIMVARWLWRTAVSARGTIVERYLAARGITGDPCGALSRLRFHPRAAVLPWAIGAADGDARLRAPAMIALIEDGEGAPMGVHATYLARDGSGKAELPQTHAGDDRPSRKIWGGLQGGGVWLSPRDAEGPLIDGEGIETVLSFVQRFDRPCRAVAALSLDNLQGGVRRTPQGAWPMWNIAADYERPPMLIADPGDVVVLVDADMKPLRSQKVQARRGAKWERGDLSGADRARICGVVASQHWRRAGARRVEAVRPPMGMDFNDLARAGQ